MNFNILYHWDRAEHGRDAAGAPAKIPDTIQCAADGFAGGYSGNQQQTLLSATMAEDSRGKTFARLHRILAKLRTSCFLD